MIADGSELDNVDKAILTAVQEDARFTATELAERIGVSDSTIHNRLEQLETTGVITGYGARVDPDRMGLGLHILYECSAEIPEREECASAALDIPGVVEVVELLTGEENLRVKAVCFVDDDVARIAQELVATGITVHEEILMGNHQIQPIDLFAIDETVGQ